MDDAWDVQRQAGLRLSQQQGDVQLVLSAQSKSGAGAWTFVILRGADLQDIQGKADKVLADLGVSVTN